MTILMKRASDNVHWMQSVLRSSLAYQTEQGRAFSASDRWEIAGGATEYLELRIPEGSVVRAYDRLSSADAESFSVDLVSADSITAGTVELAHVNLRLGQPLPASRIYRGVTGVVNPTVKEYSYIPAQRGPQSSGAIANNETYRIIKHTPVPSLLRITNTGEHPAIFNLIIIFTEQPDG